MEASMEVPAHRGAAFHPLAPLGRSWRRMRRRPRATQVRTALIIIAIVVGLVAWLVLAPTGTPGGSGSAGAAEVASSSTKATPVTQASTSSRGVTATTINVVFPVVAINSLAGKEGFAEDKEYNEQVPAIHLFVNQINNSGGINGRKINPIITQFDPTNDANMQALCQQWTQGSPAAFAVVDGIGTWEEDNQLCVAQQGQTPLISAWSTTTNWTNLGSPYLWWTGPDMAPVLAAVVQWGESSGRLGHGKKVGVVVSDQAPDQDALNDYLLPGPQEGRHHPSGRDRRRRHGPDGRDQHRRAAGRGEVQGGRRAVGHSAAPRGRLLPLHRGRDGPAVLPPTAPERLPVHGEVALGLIPIPYEQALNGQEGVTTETLGGFDDNRPESQGGYDPGVRSCYNTWHAYHPKPIAGTTSFYIEEQGPIQAWCGAIRLFATAAKNAGKDLNRRTFVEAMSKITNYPGTLSPVWSFGPDKFYGPTEYQVVKIHNNVPPSSQCKLKTNHQPQGTCWVTVQPFKPLPTSG